MRVMLLNRIRSYVSGGKRAKAVHSKSYGIHRDEALEELDKYADDKLNEMSHVELIKVLEKTIGPAITKALEDRD